MDSCFIYATAHSLLPAFFTLADSYIGAIENVVLSENGSSVTVSCPVLTPMDSVNWFMYDTDTTTISVFTGISYTINATGRYYCQATEQRGVYRSNTFTVYRVGEYYYQ